MIEDSQMCNGEKILFGACMYHDKSVNFVNEIKHHEDDIYGNDVHRLCGNGYVSSELTIAPVTIKTGFVLSSVVIISTVITIPQYFMYFFW